MQPPASWSLNYPSRRPRRKCVTNDWCSDDLQQTATICVLIFLIWLVLSATSIVIANGNSFYGDLHFLCFSLFLAFIVNLNPLHTLCCCINIWSSNCYYCYLAWRNFVHEREVALWWVEASLIPKHLPRLRVLVHTCMYIASFPNLQCI